MLMVLVVGYFVLIRIPILFRDSVLLINSFFKQKRALNYDNFILALA